MRTKLFRRSLAVLLALLMMFSPVPTGTAASVDTEVTELLNAIGDSYQETAEDWKAMDMAAHGRAKDVNGGAVLENALTTYANGNTTDLARTVIVLTALGVDASKVYSVQDHVYYDFLAKMGAEKPSYEMQAIFGLKALDSGDYDDRGAALNRQSCLTYLLDRQSAWAAGEFGVDTAAMAVAALAPYKGNTQVQTAIDKALNYLSAAQNEAGHFGNSMSTAMVAVALTALGVDPGAGTGDFAEKGNSVIDGLLAFRVGDQFGYDNHETACAWSTEQAFRALVAYHGYLKCGKKPWSVYRFDPQAGHIITPGDPVITPTDPQEPEQNTITVYFTLRGLDTSLNEETWIGNKKVTVPLGASVADVIIQAINDESGYSQSGAEQGFVTSVTRNGYTLSMMQEGLPNSGWLFKVNSALATEGAAGVIVSDNDHILLYFTKDWTLDPDAGNIPEEEKPQDERATTIRVTPVVKDNIAVAAVDGNTIKDLLARLGEGAGDAAEIKVQVAAAPGTATTRVELKAGDVKAIAGPENMRLTIESETATLTLDAETLAGIIKGAADNITVRLTVTAVASSRLDDERQKIIGDAAAYGLEITVGDAVVNRFDGKATVFLSYIPAAGTDPAKLTVHHLGADLQVTPLKDARYDTERGGFVFTTTHFSLFFIAEYTVAPVNREWANPFTDVREADWFFDVVQYINSNQLMAGTTVNEFAPRAPMTRAMLVTVLHRHEGEPPAAANAFTDVAADAWYAPAVAWAAENDVVAGYGNGPFGPHDNVTREQVAAILRGYSAQKGLDGSERADLSAYADAGAISPWAREAVAWAAATDLIRGRSGKELVPKGAATRAEVGAILMRYIKGNAA